MNNVLSRNTHRPFFLTAPQDYYPCIKINRMIPYGAERTKTRIFIFIHLSLSFFHKSNRVNLFFDCKSILSLILCGYNRILLKYHPLKKEMIPFPNAGLLRYRGQPLTRQRLGNATFRRLFRLEVALLFQNAGTMLFHETVEADLHYSLNQLDAPGADRNGGTPRPDPLGIQGDGGPEHASSFADPPHRRSFSVSRRRRARLKRTAHISDDDPLCCGRMA